MLKSIQKATRTSQEFSGKLYLIDKENVTTTPPRATDSNALDGDFVLAAAAVWVEIPFAKEPGKNKYNSTPGGDRDGAITNTVIEIVVPGSDPVISNALEGLKGIETLALLRDKDSCTEGVLYDLFGNDCDGVLWTIAQKNDGTKDYLLTGSVDHGGLHNYYNGAVAL